MSDNLFASDPSKRARPRIVQIVPVSEPLFCALVELDDDGALDVGGVCPILALGLRADGQVVYLEAGGSGLHPSELDPTLADGTRPMSLLVFNSLGRIIGAKHADGCSAAGVRLLEALDADDCPQALIRKAVAERVLRGAERAAMLEVKP